MRHLLHTLPLLLLPLAAAAQGIVEPVACYHAVVFNYNDSTGQYIKLEWLPSATQQVAGYHICSGSPCLSLDTVYGRESGAYYPVDHSPAEPHTYRIHAFDSALNVSALTPAFGPSVLTAEVPECEGTVHLSWTPYVGMPGGVMRYELLMLDNWGLTDTLYTLCTVDTNGPFEYRFDLPDTLADALGFFVFVRANNDSPLYNSQSNTVVVRRRTEDRAAYFAIDSVSVDSLHSEITVSMSVDSSFHGGTCTLWRSIDGSPWTEVYTFASGAAHYSYVDRGLHPNADSLHCYQLSVTDGCGLNPRYTRARCAVLPRPPQPSVYVPNAVVLSADEPNNRFLPVARGLMGDIYELSVYDRRGLLVYSTTDPSAGWRPDASTPQGAYAYALRLRFIDGHIENLTGTITVIK